MSEVKLWFAGHLSSEHMLSAHLEQVPLPPRHSRQFIVPFTTTLNVQYFTVVHSESLEKDTGSAFKVPV
jgi:hypothetical protein